MLVVAPVYKCEIPESNAPGISFPFLAVTKARNCSQNVMLKVEVLVDDS